MSPVALAHRHPRPAALAGVLVLVLAVVVPIRLTLVTSLAIPAVTVNSTGDAPDVLLGDGLCDTGVTLPGGAQECTLRAALEEANDPASDVDTVEFGVPVATPGDVVTIAPATALPTVTVPLTINGRTQSGWTSDPIVAIDGSAWAGPTLDLDGGSTTVLSLVVHGSGGVGIDLDTAGGNVVSGTWVGVLPDGVTAAGTAGDGIRVGAGATGTVLGGAAAGEGLVVANAGGHGVHVLASGTTLRGSSVGTAADGTTPAGAVGDGVRFDGVAAGLVTGTTVTANGGNGITVTGGSDDVAVVDSTVVANGALGIDLGPVGPTGNDGGDGDGGDNGLLNHPVPVDTGPTTVTVELDVPAGAHRLDVFANPGGADPSGFGEGEVLIGTTTVTHPGGGPATYDVPVSGTAAGDVLTALATEDLGGGAYGATSEFSPAVTATVAVVDDAGDAGDASPGDGRCATAGGGCTLRAALEEAAASGLDGIDIAIPSPTPVTIQPATDLPPVPVGVELDATTQPGWAGTPAVALDGVNVTGPVLELAGAGATVRGLAVHGGPADGLRVTGDGTTIAGTWVGLLPDGSTTDGNGSAGVRVDGAVGVLVTDGRIEASGGAGVAVTGLTADDVAVVDTLLRGNGALGIDLGDDGISVNDLLDVDAGPNSLLNRPAPRFATPSAVEFSLDVPAGDYRIDLFRNPGGADPSGAGEAEELLLTTVVTHPGGGEVDLTLPGLTGVAEGDVLTLLATEDLGGGTYGSSSELSDAIVADDHVLVVNDTGDDPDVSVGDGVCDTGGVLPGGDPSCTLRGALQEANAAARVLRVDVVVPGGGPVTITPGSDLPAITSPLELDATTQGGFAGDPLVAVDGAGTTAAVLAVGAAAPGSVLRGLALHGGGGHGLLVAADDVTVTDTWLGLLPDGVTTDGNAGDGLRVDGVARVLFDGGRSRDNGGNGVSVVGAAADDVAVVDTTITGNAGLGIDLGDDGVTANDAGDGDTGPNALFNRPVIRGMSEAGGTVTLDLELDTASGDVLLQVFTTADVDPSGAGEGDALVASATVVHPGGTATHSVSFAGDLTQAFTATATEALGGGAWGATSEFSRAASRPVATDDPSTVPGTLATAGALSHWRLGEPAGTLVADAGTLGADGTTAGGANRGVSGVLAGDADAATGFDGADDVVVVPHDAGWLLAEGTVSLFVRADALVGTQTLFSKDASGLGDGGHAELRILADGSVEYEQGTTSGTTTVSTTAGTVAVATWHHVAATFGPRGLEVWVDGRRAAAATTATTGWDASAGGATGNTEPITLGASQRNSSPGTADVLDRHLDGRLDEVAVVGTQLEGATIAALAGGAAQAYRTASDTSLAVTAAGGVLANDHDADQDALSATLVAGPASAAAFTLAVDGSFSYTPVAGFVGTDSFTYTASDGTGTSDPATATITVVPAPERRVVDDSTGNGHEGVPLGGLGSADGVAGKVGGAFDLDGSDDRVRIDNLDVAGDRLTISAWVEADTFGTDPLVLTKAVGIADADVQWRLLLDDLSGTTARGAGAVRTTAGLAAAIGGASFSATDGWVHLAARYDGTEVVLFVDGQAVATAAHAGALQPDPTVPTGIGATADGGRPVDGRVDEVRVSSVARSDAWIAAAHATQDDPATAITVGAVQTSPSTGWTTDTAQARSGTASALAPSNVFRSWLTLDGLAEAGLEVSAWWRVNTLTGLDTGQGVRAGDAAGTGPVQQDETGLFGTAGWDLGQVDGARTQLLAPPAGQSPTVDTWQRVVVRSDTAGRLSATADGTDLPASGSVPAGVLPTGTFGLRVGELPPTARWWIDDVRIRRYVVPEPVATLRRTEQAP